jgi:branched-chain amino acid aminotransferase
MGEGILKVKYVWQNGEIVPLEKATVNVLTPAVLFGANVFEGLVAYWNAEEKEIYCFRFADHFKRLFESLKIMRMSVPYTIEDFFNFAEEIIKANNFKEDIHLLHVVYVDDIGGLFKHKKLGMYIAAQPHIKLTNVTQGMHCCTSTWMRISDLSSPPRVKCGPNYQNSRLSSLEADAKGFDWAIIMTNRGKVSEAPGGCLFMVRKGAVVTPPVTSDILESVTRDTLIHLFSKELGISVLEREIDRTELYIAEEVFLCGSGAEVTPMVSLDRINIGNGKVGPITQKIQKLYFDVVRGIHKGYSEWRTPVYTK